MCKQGEIAIQQTIIPDYRLGVFEILRSRYGSRLNVYAGDADFGGSPVSATIAWERYSKIVNHYFGCSRLLWQSHVIGHLIRAEVAILNGNLRIVSNLPVLLMRRILRRRTLIWGHASGRSGIAKHIRRLYNNLSDGVIAYTESDKTVFESASPAIRVWVAANSCVFAKDCVPVSSSDELPDSFIYVGRLIPEKKVDVLLRAFSQAKSVGLLPKQAKLIIVGSGPEKEGLVEYVEAQGLSGEVRFTGHVSETRALRDLYSCSIASVSPGYVGLSATQSFSFGVPMLVSRDERHSPEIEACHAGFNALFFDTHSISDFSNLLQSVWGVRESWLAKREDIANWTKANYSFEAMSEAFISAIEASPCGTGQIE